jgi:hypothetical protein
MEIQLDSGEATSFYSDAYPNIHTYIIVPCTASVLIPMVLLNYMPPVLLQHPRDLESLQSIMDEEEPWQ